MPYGDTHSRKMITWWNLATKTDNLRNPLKQSLRKKRKRKNKQKKQKKRTNKKKTKKKKRNPLNPIKRSSVTRALSTLSHVTHQHSWQVSYSKLCYHLILKLSYHFCKFLWAFIFSSLDKRPRTWEQSWWHKLLILAFERQRQSREIWVPG